MFFTREDILKIQNALLKLSVKDSELPSAEPVTYDDTLSIVQDGKNKQIKIEDFFNQISIWKREDFINITDKYDEHYISLIEAIKLVPILQRKDGLVITFQDIEGNWEIYQFRGNITEFFEKDKWFNLYDYRNYIVQSIVPDEEDLTASTPDENGNSLVSLKDRVYDPTSFSGKGYKILRKNIQSVNIASTKITITEIPSSDGTLSFTINGKETQIAVSATTDNTTALVTQKVASALQASITEYDVSKDSSIITLTRKSSGLVTPSTFSTSTTGVVCTITDSTKREFRNILTPDMINKPNTIYEIKYDFDLDGKTLEVPENCTLKFEGGSLKNGKIVGNNTFIQSEIRTIFNNTTCEGTFSNEVGYPEWFFIPWNVNNVEYDDYSLQCTLNLFKEVCISKKYKTYGSLNLKSHCHLYGGGSITNTHAAALLKSDGIKNIHIENLRFEQTDKIRSFALFYTASYNIRIEHCICENIGIVNSDGIYRVNSTYSGKVEVLFNKCHSYQYKNDGTEIKDNIVTAIFLTFTDNILVKSNEIENVFQAITIWGGDGVRYEWYDINNKKPIFGSNNGTISDNIITNCLGSGIFIALSRQFVISNNKLENIEAEILDAEFSEDILFIQNKAYYSNTCLTIFGWRRNVIFQNNDVIPLDNGCNFWFYVEPLVNGKYYSESLETLGAIHLINNRVNPYTDKSIVKMSAINGDVYMIGNYLKNNFMEYLYPGYTFVSKDNTYIYNKLLNNTSITRITSHNIYKNNRYYFEGNIIPRGIFITSFDVEKNALIDFSNNYIKAYAVEDIFHTYNINNGNVYIIFENNILSKDIRNYKALGINFVEGYTENRESVKTKLRYRNNYWEDTLTDLYSDFTTQFGQTLTYNMFTKDSFICYNGESSNRYLYGLSCVKEGYYGSTGIWAFIYAQNKDILGTTTNRPSLNRNDEGFEFYDTTLKKKILWNGANWVNIDGTTLT